MTACPTPPLVARSNLTETRGNLGPFVASELHYGRTSQNHTKLTRTAALASLQTKGSKGGVCSMMKAVLFCVQSSSRTALVGQLCYKERERQNWQLPRNSIL